ncbi:MAG: hypothetical protein QOD77_788 [Thermoplasmata archaeon]|jgi:uncharacterized membrane protein (DUF106 family)|nr:hypothetical protein [Thermoplasmata archaeon]
MADAKPAPPRPKMGFLTILSIVLVFFILFNNDLRLVTGRYAGYVLDPLVGFGGHYPVLTILLAGSLLVIGSTVVRHFTTDWLETARTQAYMRHFQREKIKATKENNTYKLKVLNDAQPEIMARSQALQGKQLKSMPITMIVAVPLFAWLTTWLYQLDYTWFTAPWNPQVNMFANNGVLFGTSVFPHWVLLYMLLSIPLGSLIGKAMKYYAWKERWAKRHPGVHG